MSTPDLTGFRAAQDRLRVGLGADITFRIPVAPVYAPDVEIDPESGEPYDPTVVPVSGGGTTDAIVHVGVIFDPVSGDEGADVASTASGIRRDKNAALDIGVTDYPAMQNATRFVLNDVEYKITDVVPDGVGDTFDRYLAFGEAL